MIQDPCTILMFFKDSTVDSCSLPDLLWGINWDGFDTGLSSSCLSSWCNASSAMVKTKSMSSETSFYTHLYAWQTSTNTITSSGTEYVQVVSQKVSYAGGMSNSFPVVTDVETKAFAIFPNVPVLPPCCGPCQIYFGGTAQVLHWPTPAPQPPITSVLTQKDSHCECSHSVI